MKKDKIDSLKKLKNKYPLVFEEVIEQFEMANKKLKNFELDYFEHDKETDKFYLTLSCGVSSDLIMFDMHGELIEDEIAVDDASFSKDDSKNEDVYDTEDYKEYSDNNDYDSDY